MINKTILYAKLYISNRLLLSLIFLLTLTSPIAAQQNLTELRLLVWKPYLQQLGPTRVIILWATRSGTSPEVRYATDASYSTVASGSSRPVSGAQLHRVELSGLQPDTTYFYKVYTDNEDLLPAEVLSFQTAPATGSSAPFTFMVVGDYGKNSDSQKRLRDQMLRDSFRFILTTGDNAYSAGSYLQFDSNVFQIYQDLFSRAGLFPTLGNHDYGTDNAAPYLDIFELPQNAWRPAEAERYYSFDFGNIHVVALDSNAPLDAADSAAGDDMFDWLRADLSQTRQPWRIIAFHHSAYSAGSHGSDSRVQAKLGPIFENYGVDLVFSGHDHTYQRSKPLRNGQIMAPGQGGIVYIVSGAGSAASYPCGSTAWLEVAYCAMSSGLYSRVSVNGASLTVAAIDENGQTLDSQTLTKALNVPLSGVELSGPALGLAGAGLSLTARLSPITATLPITYIWQATGQAPVTSRGGLAQTIAFTWPATGSQTITVTASNAWASQTRTRTVDIVSPAVQVYLPLLLKSPPD